MAELTQAEVDALTCMLCDDPADVVVPREEKAEPVSLCAQCLREMLDVAEAPRTQH